MSVSSSRSSWILFLSLFALLPGVALASNQAVTKKITIPEEDRFVPYALTIHVGDSVEWVNMDEDDHKILSVDAWTTADHKGLVHVLPGLDNNGGKPGTFTLKFAVPGRFVYRCAFHSHMDSDHQPVAPGPKGGIKDDKGNYGTPMTSVISVLPVGQ